MQSSPQNSFKKLHQREIGKTEIFGQFKLLRNKCGSHANFYICSEHASEVCSVLWNMKIPVFFYASCTCQTGHRIPKPDL